MKKVFFSVLMAAAATLLFCSCDPIDNPGDKTGTLNGSWRLETLVVEISANIGDYSSTNPTTIDYTNDYCYLYLGKDGYAQAFYNLKMSEPALYSYDAETGKIHFSNGISVDGKLNSIVFLGYYNVELNGDKLVLRQGSDLGIVGNQNVYTFHREERKE